MANKFLVVGNWKMDLSHKAALEVAGAIKKMLAGIYLDVDVVIAPSFTSLPAVATKLAKNEKVQLGAQNVHWEEGGAWTGEVSVSQLTPFARWCIVGHSERRQLVGETDEQVRAKVYVLQKHGLTPIVCVGETADERNRGETVSKITRQATAIFTQQTGVSVSRLVIAYEPIWAIGTGETPDPAEAAQTMLLIRKIAAEKLGAEAAEKIRILYGGSVNAGNAADFVSEPGVDGVLVGGASVKSAEFVNIVKAVEKIERTF
ncbi:MAG: triose-phosphate isomerase [Candidatus Andersenbacteria bacterium]|nr:triose-phosphate isomerase [bacterium]MDZ4225614.1 triose-phosphate isomerase [Candidatus Andersenbacteria bacterium]